MTAVYADPAMLFARMLRRVVRTESGCWFFTGTVTSRGYGCVGAGKRGCSILGHRLAVLARDGEIPAGLTVDHQCHDSLTCRDDVDCLHRRCVNPAHLKVMTMGDNARRKWEQGLCLKGHPLTVRASDGKRQCLTCRRADSRDRAAGRSKLIAAKVAEFTP